MNLQEATKHITFEYIKTGCEGYQTLINYINGDMKGHLYLDNTKVSFLPEGLKVGGDLNMFETNVNTIPKELFVKGSFDLSNTPITSLPENLKVGGDLYLCHTNINTLPEDLEVGCSLYLTSSKITSLSKFIKVGSHVFLRNSPIGKKYFYSTSYELKPLFPNVEGNIFT